MQALPKVALAVVAWEGFWWLWQQAERKRGYAQAKALADAAGKPLLVIGEPDGEYPCGDVTVDIRAKSACPNYVRRSAEDLSVFKDKQFGAAFISCTLEFTCAPELTLRELHRVADHVVVVAIKPWRLMSFLPPGRKWILAAGRPAFPLPWGCCNRPGRYGTEKAT